MEWQPIETAPRDGKVFIAYYPKQGWVLKSWGPYVWPCWFHKHVFGQGGSWVTGIKDDMFKQPTHWMPLPEPPK